VTHGGLSSICEVAERPFKPFTLALPAVVSFVGVDSMTLAFLRIRISKMVRQASKKTSPLERGL